MKIMLRAAIAVFSVGIGSVHAGDGDGNSATTLFTSIQNKLAVPAHDVAAQAPTIAAQSGGAAVQGPDVRSQSQSTWLFRVFSLPEVGSESAPSWQGSIELALLMPDPLRRRLPLRTGRDDADRWKFPDSPRMILRHLRGSTTTGGGNDLRIGENKRSPIEVSSFTLEGAPISERAFSWPPHRSAYLAPHCRFPRPP
jgi:hypothetical protein